ncbi:hypothetical protein CDAR_191231 [Caerostris darwini]|uniref:Uncharacterized protein n=1 Tax=Caerostris darwini TaxID=1538125 RepID=A0AAV4X0E8_9ARAC|nr:hypothetical protein CDAR_191231 [Caerostris darwini]
MEPSHWERSSTSLPAKHLRKDQKAEIPSIPFLKDVISGVALPGVSANCRDVSQALYCVFGHLVTGCFYQSPNLRSSLGHCYKALPLRHYKPLLSLACLHLPWSDSCTMAMVCYIKIVRCDVANLMPWWDP